MEDNSYQSYQERISTNYFKSVLKRKFVFIVSVPFVAIILTVFIFHFYRVDGSSMEKTFQDQDLLIVEKLGQTISSNYVPKRYEIVIFSSEDLGSEKDLIKRVIGLPGDRVVINDKKAVIINKEYPEGINIDQNHPNGLNIISPTIADFPIDTVVQNDEVFVLGDNRPGSDDSRVLGNIKTDKIVGRVIVRLLPINNLNIFF